MKSFRGTLLPAIVCLAAILAWPGAAAAEKLECLVTPYLEVNLSSPVPGTLDEVLVDRGDRVTQGQALARLVSAAEEARLALLVARAEFAERKVERSAELYRKQMISPYERDELETDAQLLRLEIREAEELLKMRTIRSPVNGVVVERLLSPGEYVASDPILEIAQIHPLRVEVAVPLDRYGQIKVGMQGRVEWEAAIQETHMATVTVVDPVVDAASGTVGVRLELPNPAGRLPAGTKCWVTF